MKTFESRREGQDGTTFYIRGWEPDGKPKAVVVLLHGLGEHVGRYAHVGEALSAAGYVLVGFDLRGHGKSNGIRGHFPSLDVVMQDVQGFFNFLPDRYSEDLPRFLYGHSLGGLLAFAYASKYGTGLSGVIATGPGLRTALQEQKVKVMLAKVLGTLAPTLLMPSGLEVTALSRDPNIVTAYVNDPLVHDRASMGFGKTALATIDVVFEQASRFPVPLLIMYGSADKITYPSGGEDFARRVPGDVTLKIWGGLYHEIHNEPEQAEVFQFMIKWLDDHLKK